MSLKNIISNNTQLDVPELQRYTVIYGNLQYQCNQHRRSWFRRGKVPSWRRLGIIFHTCLPILGCWPVSRSLFSPTLYNSPYHMQFSGAQRTQYPYPGESDQQTSPQHRPSVSGSTDISMSSQQSGRSSSASSRSQSSKNPVSPRPCLIACPSVANCYVSPHTAR